MTTKVADSFVNEQEALFLRRNDLINRWGGVVSSYQALPGLVGFWPMSSVQRSTGNVYDLSGQGRTLTYNGNPTFNYVGLVPYIAFDGTGDFLSRVDETDLDITGGETIYNSSVRGLTCGGWFYFSSASPREILMSKADGGSVGMSWWLEKSSGVLGVYTGTGAAFVTTFTTSIVVADTWYHIIFRYVPSTSLQIYLNGVLVASNSVSIPATLLNTTQPFNIGSTNNGTLPLAGRASLCFLCANALSDSFAFSLFEQSRVLFGV